MTEELQCWRCGHGLGDEPLPLARLAECRRGGGELHCCLLCKLYDTSVAKHCREPIAEEVKEKARANFCDYFQPRPGAYMPRDVGPEEQARRELEALFGAAPQAPESAEAEPAAPETDEARARRELDRLFGGGN
jgi:hypothetical protein